MRGNPMQNPAQYMDTIDAVRDKLLAAFETCPEILDMNDLASLRGSPVRRYRLLRLPLCSYAQGFTALREAKAAWRLDE